VRGSEDLLAIEKVATATARRRLYHDIQVVSPPIGDVDHARN
jgi:hypothetical protein